MMMKPKRGGDETPTAEERRERGVVNLAKAEQRRVDGERARADYNAENDAQNANMARLRALRLAKEAQDRTADGETPSAPSRPAPAKRAVKRAISNRK